MNLKELAREKGTNLKQVAEKCGIPPTTLYAISSGSTNFDKVGIGTMIKVANALGMTAEELYIGDFTKPITPEKMDDLKARAIESIPSQGIYVELDLIPKEEELTSLFRKMDKEHRELLLQTARSFSALSGENGEDDGRTEQLGAMDAVMGVRA